MSAIYVPVNHRYVQTLRLSVMQLYVTLGSIFIWSVVFYRFRHKNCLVTVWSSCSCFGWPASVAPNMAGNRSLCIVKTAHRCVWQPVKCCFKISSGFTLIAKVDITSTYSRCSSGFTLTSAEILSVKVSSRTVNTLFFLISLTFKWFHTHKRWNAIIRNVT